MKKNTKSSARGEAEGFKTSNADQSPCFCGQKAAELFFSLLKLQPQKMNRSFNKSQPLRNADCNAVEVKSKVSSVRCVLQGLLRDLGRK